MLVRELISHMHCSQVASISINASCLDAKGKITVNTLYTHETQGSMNNLNIPKDLLYSEVDYYCIRPSISTYKRTSNEYEDLPYIELILNFDIMLKEVIE